MFVSLMQVCIVYIVKEVASFPGRKRTCDRATQLQRFRPAGRFRENVNLQLILITVV